MEFKDSFSNWIWFKMKRFEIMICGDKDNAGVDGIGLFK